MDGWKRPASAARAQLVGERLRLLGGDVEPEHLDGDQTIARRFIGAKDGTKRANTDLMQHPEGAEAGGGECGWVVSGQGYASGDRKNVTQVADFDGCGRLDRSRAIGLGSLREVTASNRSDAASSERNAPAGCLDMFPNALREYDSVSSAVHIRGCQ